jgi:NitT/TauT family transport system ATP-binding protein
MADGITTEVASRVTCPDGPRNTTVGADRPYTRPDVHRDRRLPAVTNFGGAAIRIDELAKSFGSLEVVTPTSLSIEPGSFVSLLGPSGCGKSTLLRLVAGLETASAGSVTIDDGSPAVARRTKRLAMVPQQPGLLPWRNVEANARLLLDVNAPATPADHPAPRDLLDEVGLAGFLDSFPHQLSGGMQQRVALVRGFALGAPLLLMDEPFAALDEITRAEMRRLLARLLQRHPATVLFVTHSIAEAVHLSDRVLVCSPRPATIVADVPIPLPRPRTSELDDEPAFLATCAEVRRRLHEGMAR